MNPNEFLARLDRPADLLYSDRKGMWTHLERFPSMLSETMGRMDGLSLDLGSIEGIVLCGMGGSAIAGDVVMDVHRGSLKVPMEVVRSYTLPYHVGSNTLAMIVSFSGNTEEALSCFDQAVDSGATLVAITSGGRLAERAQEVGVPLILLEAGGIMPRAALPRLLGSVLGVLGAASLIPAVDISADVDELSRYAASCSVAVPHTENHAKAIAHAILGKRVTIAVPRDIRSVGLRWKCQVNENAKVRAYLFELPEALHNDVETVSDFTSADTIIMLPEVEGPGIVSRKMATLAEMLRERGVTVIDDITLPGSSRLSSILGLMLLGDLASFFNATGRGLDPTPVDDITRLKAVK